MTNNTGILLYGLFTVFVGYLSYTIYNDSIYRKKRYEERQTKYNRMLTGQDLINWDTAVDLKLDYDEFNKLFKTGWFDYCNQVYPSCIKYE